MAQTPSEIANLALDACSIPFQLGNIEQGGAEANILLRHYGECRRQLFRAAPWNFARKSVPLVLLADASGATPNVSTVVVGGQTSAFCYEYSMPIDCMRVRYIPGNPLTTPGAPAGNITPTNPQLPLLGGGATVYPFGQRVVPTRFLVTNDPNITAAPDSNYAFQQGQSPAGSTVIMSNVQQAQCVYTGDILYPSVWDVLFTNAMKSYLAQQCAPALWAARGKPEFGLKVQAQNIAITKVALAEARAVDGSEMTVSADIKVDWIAARRTGGGSYGWSAPGAGGMGGFGCWGAGYAGSLLFGDGSSY
jgi:hypothetical protein